MSETADIIGAISTTAQRAAAKRADREIATAVGLHSQVIQSPIEMIMLAALIGEGIRRNIGIFIAYPIAGPEMEAARKRLLFKDTGSSAHCRMAAQFPIGN